MTKHYIKPTALENAVIACRLGTSASDNYTSADVGKCAKLVAESAFGLSAAGDDIEGFITSIEGTQEGWTVGGVQPRDMAYATFDGLQATPGTGTIAVGDYVVTGTVVAKGTYLGATYAKVCKATTPANSVYKWRVMSLGTAGTGAVGTVGVIARIN